MVCLDSHVEILSCDVLVVGGGGAGLRAAIAVAETHPELSVAVISKVYPMRSHTVSAEGGAAAVIKAGDSLDEHAYDTISGGDWLCDQDAVEVFVKEAPAEMLRLEHWGCPWSREPDGHVAVRPFGGMKVRAHLVRRRQDRLPHAPHAVPDLPSSTTASTATTSGSSPGCWSTTGAARASWPSSWPPGRSRPSRRRPSSSAPAGAARVFPFTTNANIKNGDGMALAYRAGAPLKDMEFVQYHPTGLPFTGILITEAARAEGGWLLNKDGYRYLQDYDLGKPEPKPVLRSMELGPARPPLAGLRQGAGEGADARGPLRRTTSTWTSATWDGRSIDKKTPVRPRAVPEVREHRSGRAR